MICGSYIIFRVGGIVCVKTIRCFVIQPKIASGEIQVLSQKLLSQQQQSEDNLFHQCDPYRCVQGKLKATLVFVTNVRRKREHKTIARISQRKLARWRVSIAKMPELPCIRFVGQRINLREILELNTVIEAVRERIIACFPTRTIHHERRILRISRIRTEKKEKKDRNGLITSRSTTLFFLFILTSQRLPFSVEINSEFSRTSYAIPPNEKIQTVNFCFSNFKEFRKTKATFGRGMPFAENEKLTFSNISPLLTSLGNLPVWAPTLSLGGIVQCFCDCFVRQSAAQYILYRLLKRHPLKPVKCWSSPNPSSPRCCFETDSWPQFHFRRVSSSFEMKVDCQRSSCSFLLTSIAPVGWFFPCSPCNWKYSLVKTLTTLRYKITAVRNYTYAATTASPGKPSKCVLTCTNGQHKVPLNKRMVWTQE